MDNKTLASSVTKFFYYANNWDTKLVTISNGEDKKTDWLPGFFTAFPIYIRPHMLAKWEEAYDKGGPRSALMFFFAELDGSYRADVLKYINENYDYNEGFGLDLSRL
jgi:hypothetical protein